ncbi:invasin domain 3-containing protein [Paenibacillus elgii]|uniref:invasin domain 3-containing protein n=1 Tax=Paenibacillus elgii TaxID=189691 RepID=UPI001300C48A|nr:invasin domain 3-containing protein [Paenibacillus elgii]
MNTFYDTETGQFIGIRVILSADKTEITADGTDTATVTASFKNWDGTPAEYEKDLIATVDGIRTVVKKANGVYEIKISSTEAGTKTVTLMTAADPHLMESNSVTVKLVKGETDAV